MKQFDCQDMPEKIKRSFFDATQDEGAGNDTWVEFDIRANKKWYEDEGNDPEDYEDKIAVSQWLKKKGCREGSTVLIKHWW